MWVTCALGPYNFDFMTSVHHEIMSRYHPDGLFFNRWDGSGDCYCVHCRENFKAATGLDLPRTNNPQDPARRSLHPLAPAASHRRHRHLEHRNPQNQSSSRLHPEQRQRSPQPPRRHRSLPPRSHARRRPPGPPRTPAALAHGQNRQRVSRHHGQQARHRPLRRRPRRALPLERQRQRPRRNSHLGPRRHRQRHAPLVQQILRHPPR